MRSQKYSLDPSFFCTVCCLLVPLLTITRNSLIMKALTARLGPLPYNISGTQCVMAQWPWPANQLRRRILAFGSACSFSFLSMPPTSSPSSDPLLWLPCYLVHSATFCPLLPPPQFPLFPLQPLSLSASFTLVAADHLLSLILPPPSSLAANPPPPLRSLVSEVTPILTEAGQFLISHDAR